MTNAPPTMCNQLLRRDDDQNLQTLLTQIVGRHRQKQKNVRLSPARVCHGETPQIQKPRRHAVRDNKTKLDIGQGIKTTLA